MIVSVCVWCVYTRYGRLSIYLSCSCSGNEVRNVGSICGHIPVDPRMAREQAHVGAPVEVRQGG